MAADEDAQADGGGSSKGSVARSSLRTLSHAAKLGLKIAAKRVDKRSATIEAMLGVVGGGLLAWGAAQQQAGHPNVGVPMIVIGIVVTGLYFWLSVGNRTDGVAAAVDSLTLAEAAGAQQAIADAVTGERDRLLRENRDLLSVKTSLGDRIHAMLGEARVQAGYRESMQLALSRIYATAAKIVEASGAGAANDDDLCDRLKRVLEAAESLIHVAFGVKPDELFTLSVYSRRGSGSDAVMHRFVALSSDGEEKHDKRDWPMGEGFVGEAWKAGTELVVPDRTLQAFANRFHGKGGRISATDQAKYRSVAVMPLRAGEIDESNLTGSIVGLVIATSNRAEQFLSDEQDSRALNAALLRQIAAIVGLLIKVWRSPQSEHFSIG